MKIKRSLSSGCEADQCFSILAALLKAEDVFTLENLKQKVEGCSINPRPIFRSLDATYDWKEYVSPLLAFPQLGKVSMKTNKAWFRM